MNKTNFIKALEKMGACQPAMDWVSQTPGSPEELYQSCKRGEWLEFLVRKSGVRFDRAEYDRQLAPIWAEYEQQRDALWAECWRQRDALWAEFERKKAPIRAEFERQLANIICSMASFSDIEKALEGI